MSRAQPFDPAALKVRDNVPTGAAVSLAGLPAAVSFASFFRAELQARGFGVVTPAGGEGGRGRQQVD